MKRFVCLFIVLIFISSTISVAADKPGTFAISSTAAVTVNGTSFSIQSYKIDGSDYIKLRDIAKALNGTEKQFDVGWDKRNNAVRIIRKKSYTAIGNELAVSPNNSSAAAEFCNSVIYLDGSKVSLTCYSIKGSNYFKLRDIASLLDFSVAWDNNTGKVSIDTTTGYGLDCETLMKKAISGSGTYVFQIFDDFKFDDNYTFGVLVQSSKSGSSNVKLTSEQATARIKDFISNKIIRISNGKLSLDSNEYNCNLTILPDDKGISIVMKRGNNLSVNQGELTGVIRGNTLSASASATQTTRVNGSGMGLSASSRFTVSIKALTKDQLPPLPVTNLKYVINSDDSVALTWDDPNPAGTVKSYNIYRIDSGKNNNTPVAVVTGSSWTDTSDTGRKESLVLSYGITVNGVNGKQSDFSKFININIMYRIFKRN